MEIMIEAGVILTEIVMMVLVTAVSLDVATCDEEPRVVKGMEYTP